MQFTEAIYNSPPLLLKPHRPASHHMLSYEQLKYAQSQQALLQARERDYRIQLERTAQAVKEKEREGKQQGEKLLEGLLMYQIEIERLRAILCEWDQQRRRYQDEMRKLQNRYAIKLEELKVELAREFEDTLQQLRTDNEADLQKMKSLYATRVKSVVQEINSYEEKVAQKEMELQSALTRLRIFEINNQELTAKLELKTRNAKEAQGELGKLKEEIHQEREEYYRNNFIKNAELDRYKQENAIRLQENQELKNCLQSHQGTIQELYDKIRDLEDARHRLTEKLEFYDTKCRTLEKEIEQFKSRKTQHNVFQRDEISDIKSSPKVRKTPTKENIENSSHKTKGIKNNEEEYQGQISELKNRLEEYSEEITELKREIAAKERELATKDREIISKEREHDQLRERLLEEKSREVEEAIDRKNKEIASKEKLWGDKLTQMQKYLDELGQEWLRKEREFSGLFKTIETTYLKKLEQREDELRERDAAIAEKDKLIEVKTQDLSKMTEALAQKAMQLGKMQMLLPKKK